MRRVALVLALLAAALTASACAGADGQRAQELLAQSDQALAEVKSMKFAGRLWMETPVGDFTLVMRGAGETRKGGASYMTMTAEGIPEFPPMTVVTRGESAWVKAGGSRWQRVPVPAGQATGIEQFDFTPYVKAVDVEEGLEVGGEPAVKITGVLDTAGLVNGVLGQLGSVPGGALPDVSDAFGDTRAVFYLSEVTHLPLRMLVDLSVEAGGEKAELHMDMAITSVNEPVKIPRPVG